MFIDLCILFFVVPLRCSGLGTSTTATMTAMAALPSCQPVLQRFCRCPGSTPGVPIGKTSSFEVAREGKPLVDPPRAQPCLAASPDGWSFRQAPTAR